MIMTDLSRITGAGSDDHRACDARALLEYSDAWQVAGHANVPFADLVDILQKLRERGLLEFHKSELRLTAQGEAFARELHVAPHGKGGLPDVRGQWV